MMRVLQKDHLLSWFNVDQDVQAVQVVQVVQDVQVAQAVQVFQELLQV